MLVELLGCTDICQDVVRGNALTLGALLTVFLVTSGISEIVSYLAYKVKLNKHLREERDIYADLVDKENQ